MTQLAQVHSPTEIRKLFDEKVRRGIFRPVARYLPPAIAEDRVQDGIGQTWELFSRYAAERGALVPDALLVRYCRLRAQDPGRHLVPPDGTMRRGCVLDPRNFLDGRVQVLRLDGAIDPDEDECGEGDRALIGLAEAMSASPVRKIISAIDLEAWLDGLGERDRAMLAGRAAGFELAEVAADLGVCLSTVFTRTRRLGEELASRAGVDIDGARRRRKATSVRSSIAARS